MTINRLLCLVLVMFSHSLNASIVVTSEDSGERTTEIFNNGNYDLIENKVVQFSYDGAKNLCTLYNPDQQVKIEENCDKLTAEIVAVRDEMMASMGVTKDQLAMMKKSNSISGQGDFKLRKTGSSTQVGYAVDCYKASPTREVCISAALKKEIAGEIDIGILADIFAGITNSMGDDTMGDAALKTLQAKGFVMKDVDMQLPNAGMMSLLPAAQVESIMEQMGAQPEGQVVIRVEKNKKVNYQRPNFRKVGVKQFLQMGMMGN